MNFAPTFLKIKKRLQIEKRKNVTKITKVKKRFLHLCLEVNPDCVHITKETRAREEWTETVKYVIGLQPTTVATSSPSQSVSSTFAAPARTLQCRCQTSKSIIVIVIIIFVCQFYMFVYMSFIFARFLFVCTFFCQYMCIMFSVMGGQLRWPNAFTGNLPL